MLSIKEHFEILNDATQTKSSNQRNENFKMLRINFYTITTMFN
jgi:hypothetical protein